MEIFEAWREVSRLPDDDRRRAELLLAVAISDDAAAVGRILRVPTAEVERWLAEFIAGEIGRIHHAVEEHLRRPEGPC